jgi:hypothetical protein
MVPCFSEIIQCEDIEEIQMESKGGTCLRNYKIKFHMTKYLSNLEVCECDLIRIIVSSVYIKENHLID